MARRLKPPQNEGRLPSPLHRQTEGLSAPCPRNPPPLAGQRRSSAQHRKPPFSPLAPQRSAAFPRSRFFRSCLRARNSAFPLPASFRVRLFRRSLPHDAPSLAPSRGRPLQAPRNTNMAQTGDLKQEGRQTLRPAAFLKSCENAVRRLLPSSVPFSRDGWEP